MALKSEFETTCPCCRATLVIDTNLRRIAELRKRYRAFRRQHPDRKPVYYEGRERWTPIPAEFGAE